MITLIVNAQTIKESEHYTIAEYQPLKETLNENVFVIMRCVIYVNSEYIIASEQILRGTYFDGKFYFRVENNYYSVSSDYIWDINSSDYLTNKSVNFTTIDEVKHAEGPREKAKKKDKKELEEEWDNYYP